MGRKSTLDKNVVISLFKDGMTYRAIAKKLNSKEDTIRMIIKRNANEILTKKKEERKNSSYKLDIGNEDKLEFEHSNLLDSEDLKEIMEEKNHGIMPNESCGTYAFLMWNRQSYKKGKGKKLMFDESRGKRTYAVPASY